MNCTRCRRRPRAPSHRWCRDCKNESNRRTRRRYCELSPADRFKANARSYLNSYLGRGLVTKASQCAHCQRPGQLEAHHHDYSRPLDVTWLHRHCHRAIH